MTAEKCYLNTLGMLCSAGDTAASVKNNLMAKEAKLTITDNYSAGRPLPLGMYNGELPPIPLPDNKWYSRNNQFALAALRQMDVDVSAAIQHFGPHRVGVVIGTSTSGIAECESSIKQWIQTGNLPPDYNYSQQEMGATAQFIAQILDVRGPAYGISTACSSGAKALATARRLIRAGICDAVIAGGVDTLCHLTVQGFSSLEAVSENRCNPFSKNRDGINIGEGAALFLITTEASGIELTGVGEGSDAHHISAPDPTGAGAIRCMTAALKDGSISAAEVDYINLHGTATALNDQMESIAISQVFGEHTLCSSTKPFTGHTLGAAGAVEAGICWLTLNSTKTDSLLPIHLWDGVKDPELPPLNLITPKTKLTAPPQYALSNSFAFGGNNISLLLGRIQ
ncbi:beta-ketoacyl-[acyl-carrier-protein] synthase family protein [Motiliproteus sp. MSK22-1]|uniref:beta-ketoacyl-[acyl-carrier-protein] synthase family protein n=1 Tax=Motiliproteus sp. MSK22-1 TaxID=1897630 RepID=UPI000975767C|nr:beta-ketoacyl-[acyl-carrier-protein] synthase family protein [Motiliproteus sp. MSK22-1]OMH31680.1 beta-ketoacyl-[acyl-carrier-protein] synthase II [Motiliproteus sp. MSK22-1]